MANSVANSTTSNSFVQQIIYWTNDYWYNVGYISINKHYPFMSGGPMPVLMVVVCYVIFVRLIGPKLMETRGAFQINGTIRFYNLLMVMANAYILTRGLALTRWGLDYFGCREVELEIDKDKRVSEMIQIGYFYCATKLIELLDTVFFIMRKKYQQASNLHVFHHGFILILGWFYFKLAPGGSSAIFPLLNASIHTVMYGYYFLANYPILAKYLWWKRYLTLAQIVQFILCSIHFAYHGLVQSDCNYPKELAMVGFVSSILWLVLFVNFYKSAYCTTTTEKSQRKLSEAKLIKHHRH